MDELHALLKRQLTETAPTAGEASGQFLEAVNRSYWQFEEERRALDRSLEVSSRELTAANLELRQGLSLLKSTLESTADGILVVDREGRIVLFNRRFAQLWGIPQEILDSGDDNRALDYALDQLNAPDEFLRKVRELYSDASAEAFDILEFKDGRVFERHSIPQQLDGRPVGRVWSFRDVTAAKRAEAQLRHDAIHDVLTGLPNRTLFMDRVEHAIRRSKRHLTYQFALLWIDLDRFKVVNDSLGHLVGDELLIAISARINQTIRPGDTVARLGGDEFAVLLDGIHGTEDAAIAAQRIEQAVGTPLALDGMEILPTASIGIAVSAPHYTRPDEMLRDADIAMYHAKNLGRARHELFKPGMHTKAVELLQIENDLRRALVRCEIVLHYQPIVEMATSRLIGFEALVRWNHPERGVLVPEEFIPLAEETGAIVSIGEWALLEAATAVARWQAALHRPDLMISVNISGKQLTDPSFAEVVRRVLKKSGLSPSSLGLEITETVLMENMDTVAGRLEGLRNLGAKILIDDFGTGYSSLSYLQRLPIDTLKIDRSFISAIDGRAENNAIVRTIMALADNLRMTVTAEGVESAVQWQELVTLGCHAAQGFYISQPADESAAMTMIGAENWPGKAPRPRSRVSLGD